MEEFTQTEIFICSNRNDKSLMQKSRVLKEKFGQMVSGERKAMYANLCNHINKQNKKSCLEFVAEAFDSSDT